jgi:hypothetical protein
VAVLKRITAQVGGSHPGGRKTSAEKEMLCPHCKRYATFTRQNGRMVCDLCKETVG